MTPTATLSRLNHTRAILLMGAVAIVPMLPVTLYLPILSDVATDLDCTLEQFQLTLPLFVLTQVFCMPLVALLPDLGYRLHSLYWGLLLFFAGTGICLMASGLYPFCFGRICQAISAAALMTVIPALINEAYDNNRMAEILSYVTAMGFIIPMAGPEISVELSQFFGWQSVFLVMIIYGLITLLCCRWLLGKAEHQNKTDLVSGWRQILKQWRSILTDRYTLAFLICSTGVAIVCTIYVSNSNFLYLNYYQLEEITYSYILSALYLSRMTVTIINGLILKHWHYQRVVQYSVPLLVLLTGMMFFLDWYGNAMFWVNLVIPIALFALSGFVITNALAGVLQNNSSYASQVSALSFVVFSAIGSVINGLLIIFHDGTPKMLSLFSLLILLLAWVLFIIVRPGNMP